MDVEDMGYGEDISKEETLPVDAVYGGAVVGGGDDVFFSGVAV